jgi:hypothetical protein
MTYFILDTNVIFLDVEVLNYWNANYKIIIPSFIINELSYLNDKRGRPIGNLPNILEQTSFKGFIEVYNKEIDITEETLSKNMDQRLSNVDLRLFELSKKFQEEGKDVCLVTNDRALRGFSEQNELRTFNSFQLKNYISSFRTTEINDLKQNETVDQYQNRRFYYGLIFGILITIMFLIVKNNLQLINNTLSIWGTILALCGTGTCFFLFRTHFRMIYGSLEFLFGWYVSSNIFIQKHFDFKQIGVLEIIQLTTGIYVMVRGLSNFDDGIKGTRFEPKWYRITRFKKPG